MGMHLDKATWQPKMTKPIQKEAERKESTREDLEEKDDVRGSNIDNRKATVVSIPAKEQRSPECTKSKEKELQKFNNFQAHIEENDVETVEFQPDPPCSALAEESLRTPDALGVGR